MPNHKVALVIASKGYQQVEYGIPKKMLEEMGFTVITVSDKAEVATAKDGSTTKVNLLLNDVNLKDLIGIFFIGGPGALEHLDNQTSYTLIQQAAEINLPFGAICISTRILAKAGVLKGKQATGWNEDGLLNQIYKEHGVLYIPNNVVSDDNIVTATGPQAAQEFAEEIITVLQDQKGWD